MYLVLLTRSYRTSGMAEDTLALLEHFGWSELRQLHAVGISMRGMITQGELLYQVTCSLTEWSWFGHRISYPHTRAYSKTPACLLLWMYVGSPDQIDSPMAHVYGRFGLPVGSVSVGIVRTFTSSSSKVSGYPNLTGHAFVHYYLEHPSKVHCMMHTWAYHITQILYRSSI